jgi:hypothetical protein
MMEPQVLQAYKVPLEFKDLWVLQVPLDLKVLLEFKD